MRKRLALGCILLASACSSGGEPPSGDTDATSAGTTQSTETSGETSTGTTSGTTSSEDTPPPPYVAPEGMLRRLTRPQFANAMRDVFGVEVDINNLDEDIHNGDFAVVGAASVVTSALGAEQYIDATEAAVDAVFSDPQQAEAFVGCAPASLDDACVDQFIERLGRRAWRRPLQALEVSQLKEVANLVATELSSVSEGLRYATVALFSSPFFIYRPELGESGPAGFKLNGYEVASRLAFLIWNSLPDDELLDQAGSGALADAEAVRLAAQRLLDDAAGRASVGAFAEDYLRLDRVLSQAKDQSLYPEYNEALQRGMVEDMKRVWEIIALDEDASAMTLFSTNKVVANAELAQLYGLDPSGLDSDTFKEFSLPDAGPRLGILSKSAFLSQFANQKEGSPTLRGKFMREALMCLHVEPPPPGVALDLVESTADRPMTKRERLAKHREDVACANCHAKMDPMGLPFENFDAIGKYRTLDQGLPIDPSGDFDSVPVANAVELGNVMSESQLVADCLVRKYYSYALGHVERDVDEGVIQSLSTSFEASGYRFKQLILDIVASEAFSAIAPQVN